MSDLYKTLGVSKNADQKEVKSAYRKLAKELHPDRNPGDEKIADRFKEVSSAYSIIGDEKQRKLYDQGQIDDQGQQKSPFGAGGFGGGGQQRAGGNPFGGGGGAEDLFADLFGSSGFGGRGGPNQFNRPRPEKGRDITYRMTIGFEEAALGGSRRLTLSDGKTIDVKVPSGVKTGQQIRLKNKGEGGAHGGATGDGMINITVAHHPFFRRDGNNILMDLPIGVEEAVLGTQLKVPTIHGSLSIKVPAGSSSGTRLRLKAKGIHIKSDKGDQFVILKVVLPTEKDDKLADFVEQWANDETHEQAGDAARKKLGI